MNLEKLQEIIDEAYLNYCESHISPPSNPGGPLLSDNLISMRPIQYSKEEFFEKCKNDKRFGQKWNLMVEEKKFSLSERGEMFRKMHPGKSVDDFAPHGMMEVQSLSHQLNRRYDNAGVPSREINLYYMPKQTTEYFETKIVISKQ